MTSYNGGNSRTMDADSVLYKSDEESFIDTKYKFQTILNYKYNQKNIFLRKFLSKKASKEREQNINP